MSTKQIVRWTLSNRGEKGSFTDTRSNLFNHLMGPDRCAGFQLEIQARTIGTGLQRCVCPLGGSVRAVGGKKQVQECREIISPHPALSGELMVHFSSSLSLFYFQADNLVFQKCSTQNAYYHKVGMYVCNKGSFY